MSQIPAMSYSGASSATLGRLGMGAPDSPEKNASADKPVAAPPRPSGISAPKLRSCVTCRTRKVRCDKASPCSNCRRANIPCVVPSSGKPPRWARRLERVANSAKAAQEADPGVSQVMDRLRSLEGLVKELSSQLEQAHAAASTSDRGSSSVNSPDSSNQDRDADHHVDSSPASVHKQFGRLVLGDSGQNRYISSGFWSRVNDEIDGLKMDVEGLAGDKDESSADEESPKKTPSTQELNRTPSERHGFLFRHNITSPDQNLRKFHPLPSQVPYLLNVFSENVGIMIRIVHMPTLNKMLRDLRDGSLPALTPPKEALMFAIYYSAVTSMEDEDIVANFGASKSELNLKYRLGFEHALAQADFLNVLDIVIVQALVIFLCLVRRHDSPRYVWMMTGLVIRMAQALGLHRDGSRFPNLTPFEIEMRRRLWWGVCMLDVRASEDQGMDLTIAHGSFDTKLPSNINDTDIDPETKEMPKPREGISDSTFFLVACDQCDISRQMMAVSLQDGRPRLDEQNRLLNEYHERLENKYLRYNSETGSVAHWLSITIARLVVSKMRLIVYFPILFSPTSEDSSEELRSRLFISAIEVAEYNHALNAEHACRYWRWIFQTYTHWYAVVYMLIEASRRPWGPTVERAWVALHSSWLLPAQWTSNKNLRVWVPLRKLMAKARRHRDAELERLRNDPQAAHRLEAEDRLAAQPASPGPFPSVDSAEYFRDRWRELVDMPLGSGENMQAAAKHGGAGVAPSPSFARPTEIRGPEFGSMPPYNAHALASQPMFTPTYSQSSAPQDGSNVQHGSNASELGSGVTANLHGQFSLVGQPADPSYGAFPTSATGLGPSFGAWLWADADPSVDMFADMNMDMDLNVDVDGEIDWNNWVESAKGMEWSGDSGTGGWS
ncbi:fungal-specific transcription factor domain-containing protein [Hypomontagnella monticulosa]|nr:fungal-specific transcription factor domain-containing protein [Hypomontagnella monticulosa]